jgi:hypothetical protein
MAKTTGVVYWLFDETCRDPERHGYIGVTVTWPRRLHRHRCEETSAFLPDKFEGKVLFRGHIKACLALERKLRPHSNIGWNRLPGGLSGHAGKGVPKSPEHREKIRQAALRRFAKPAERKRLSKAVKRGLKDVDQTGANNPMYGRHHSEETKQKIRERIDERGGVFGKANPNYRHGGFAKD